MGQLRDGDLVNDNDDGDVDGDDGDIVNSKSCSGLNTPFSVAR